MRRVRRFAVALAAAVGFVPALAPAEQDLPWDRILAPASGQAHAIHGLEVAMLPLVPATMRAMLVGGRRRIALVIASSISASGVPAYNIYTAAGSPTDTVEVTLTINAGADVGPRGSFTTPTVPTMTTGSGWASGSTILIVNRGRILGTGGRGGNGATAIASTSVAGSPGTAGAPALELLYPVTIDNASGYIFGGAGGGGGGGAGNNPIFAGGGGGGGGGQGNNGGINYGGKGLGLNPPGENGADGISGTLLDRGYGGTGGPSSAPGGGGGVGGFWGAAGQVGTAGSGPGGAGGAAGAAGNAITLNGHAVTWIAGNNSTQVKGAVS